MTKSKSYTLHKLKTNWSFCQKLLINLDNSIPLKTDIICAIENFNAVQRVWNATNKNLDINIENSSAIKGKLAEKKKLHKLWQNNRCPVLNQIKLNQKQIKFSYQST